MKRGPGKPESSEPVREAYLENSTMRLRRFSEASANQISIGKSRESMASGNSVRELIHIKKLWNFTSEN